MSDSHPLLEFIGMKHESIGRLKEIKVPSEVLTLRDHIAITVSNSSLFGKVGDTYDEEAKQRYLFADAMLRARNNGA